MTMLANDALDQLFREARTHIAWQDKDIPTQLLEQLYDLFKWGPTAMNCQPARVVFVRSAEAKERLKPTLAPGNVEKTMAAPVTAIIAYDTAFYEHLPEQFPVYPDAAEGFKANAEASLATAQLNSGLQAGYFILAARSLGLDCGPMTGFEADKVNEAFFPDGRYKASMLVNLGYGEASKLYPRGPRLSFDQACRIE